ncbi:unnamed protein product [Allacma fusca]|uniref:Uncharacterized protein n=1 Tax=Allacma fusca TaxID=39272 RepID=A0A8J2KJC3_9HEXA|nr:unnamed protein product [Allacma fusca]
MSSTQDQIEAALRSILASVGQQDPVYLQRLAEDVQQGRQNENQSRSSRFSRQPSSGSESGERYNGAMSKGPVQRPYDDSTGLQGFSTVSQSLRNSMTSSDTTSAFAAAGNRMLSSSMSRTHNFSLPQISPLLKRRNTSTRSFVSKEPKRSEEFPIEIVFKSDSGCDSNDDHIRTHIRLCKEFSSDEVTGLIRAKLSKYIGDRHFSLRIQHWGGRQTSRELRFIDDLQPVPDGYVLALKKSKTIYVVIDEDEDSVGFQNNAFPRVPVSSITCANEDVEDSVSVRTYGTPRALPSTAKNINTQHQYHINEVPHHMREYSCKEMYNRQVPVVLNHLMISKRIVTRAIPWTFQHFNPLNQFTETLRSGH